MTRELFAPKPWEMRSEPPDPPTPSGEPEVPVEEPPDAPTPGDSPDAPVQEPGPDEPTRY